MRVTIELDEHTILVALMNSIGLGAKITSYKEFRSEIKEYIRLYGESGIDDHESENSVHAEAAQALINKYLKSPKP